MTLSLKNDENILSKSNKQKNLEVRKEKKIFVYVLKVTDENGRMRVRIRIH
jgi:hypothetical protein